MSIVLIQNFWTKNKKFESTSRFSLGTKVRRNVVGNKYFLKQCELVTVSDFGDSYHIYRACEIVRERFSSWKKPLEFYPGELLLMTFDDSGEIQRARMSYHCGARCRNAPAGGLYCWTRKRQSSIGYICLMFLHRAFCFECLMKSFAVSGYPSRFVRKSQIIRRKSRKRNPKI